MKIWVDAQISPTIAQWLSSAYGVQAVAVKDLGLRDAMDRDIFLAAREAKAVLLTKDRDLVDLVIQLGSPPQILWVTCGNTSNAKLKATSYRPGLQPLLFLSLAKKSSKSATRQSSHADTQKSVAWPTMRFLNNLNRSRIISHILRPSI